jgi:hypothetical protein
MLQQIIHFNPKTTPFELIHGICDEEGYIAERLQILKKAHEIELNDSFKAGNTYKAVHDKTAPHHNLNEGDYAYLHNHLFLNENKSLCNNGLWSYKFHVNNINPFSIQIKEVHQPQIVKICLRRKKESSEIHETELTSAAEKLRKTGLNQMI